MIEVGTALNAKQITEACSLKKVHNASDRSINICQAGQCEHGGMGRYGVVL